MHVVGIVTALQSEASCITKARVPYKTMVCLEKSTVLWFSGIGRHAAEAAAIGLHAGGVNALISFGVAGALNSELRPGDLVLPDSIHYAEQVFPVALAWRNQLQQLLSPQLNIVGGALATSPVTLTSEEEKRALAEKTGACAVDMESGAIAQVAADAGIPFIAIRAIIDPVEFSPPTALMGAIQPDGGVHLIRLLTLILERSVSLGTLLHLAKGMRAARGTLSTVIQSVGTELGRESIANIETH